MACARVERFAEQVTGESACGALIGRQSNTFSTHGLASGENRCRYVGQALSDADAEPTQALLRT